MSLSKISRASNRMLKIMTAFAIAISASFTIASPSFAYTFKNSIQTQSQDVTETKTAAEKREMRRLEREKRRKERQEKRKQRRGTGFGGSFS